MDGQQEYDQVGRYYVDRACWAVGAVWAGDQDETARHQQQEEDAERGAEQS